MGMYDNFVPSEKLLCYACGEELENREPDIDIPHKCILQSKSLDCLLDTYRQGEPLIVETRDKKLYIKEGWIEAYTSCRKCEKFVRYKLIIENGAWARTEPWPEEEDNKVVT